MVFGSRALTDPQLMQLHEFLACSIDVKRPQSCRYWHMPGYQELQVVSALFVGSAAGRTTCTQAGAIPTCTYMYEAGSKQTSQLASDVQRHPAFSILPLTVMLPVLLPAAVVGPAAGSSRPCLSGITAAACAGTKNGARGVASRLISKRTAETYGCTPALVDATLLFSHPYLRLRCESSCSSHCPPPTSARRLGHFDPTAPCPLRCAWYHHQMRYSYETCDACQSPIAEHLCSFSPAADMDGLGLDGSPPVPVA